MLLLSNCSKPEKLIAVPTIVKSDIPIQARPKHLSMLEVEFKVVTEDNLEEFLIKFENENPQIVFYAITVKTYENLALNIAELRRYIKQQNELIVYYENSINNAK
jgi:hypothetical protein